MKFNQKLTLITAAVLTVMPVIPVSNNFSAVQAAAKKPTTTKKKAAKNTLQVGKTQ